MNRSYLLFKLRCDKRKFQDCVYLSDIVCTPINAPGQETFSSLFIMLPPPPYYQTVYKLCDQITFGFSLQMWDFISEKKHKLFSSPLCKISGQSDVMFGRYVQKSSELLQSFVYKIILPCKLNGDLMRPWPSRISKYAYVIPLKLWNYTILMMFFHIDLKQHCVESSHQSEHGPCFIFPWLFFRRGLIMGVWNSHTSVGNILGSIVAGAFVDEAWGWSFIVPGIIIAAMGIIIFIFLITCKYDFLFFLVWFGFIINNDGLVTISLSYHRQFSFPFLTGAEMWGESENLFSQRFSPADLRESK